MLKISPAVTATNVPGAFAPNNYILFPDSEDKDLYYALAEDPTFHADAEGNPDFNLTWYFGSGATPGGICTLTVALPMPDMTRAEVSNAIAGALTQDQTTRDIAQSTFDLCNAMLANETDKIAALKTKLGFNDSAANGKAAVFKKDQGWEQFLPAKGSLKIRPIPFKSGSVTVQAFADQNAYKQGTPEFSTGKLETTPSLINSNAAVVTFNLQDLGANLFWHGLGGWRSDRGNPLPPSYDEQTGGSSVITVTYRIEFDGLLPEARATVTLDQERLAKLNIEDEVKKGSWGRTYKQQVVRGKEYNDAINDATDIVLPAVASKEDKDNVQKLLTDWAAKQLEEMVQAQLPAVKLDDLSIDGARQIKTVSKQSRTYRLTQAVTLPKNPQAQLPKIDGIVKPGTSTKKYFQLVNLNEKPYFDVNVTVAPPSVEMLKARQVERFVVTQIAYGTDRLRRADGKEVDSLEFPANEAQRPHESLSGTFDLKAPRYLEYSYLVAYTDGTAPYRVTGLKQEGVDDKYLVLSALDLGVLSVRLNGIDLPWDVLSSAKVDLQYGDWKKSISLRKDDPPVLVVKPFGQAITGQLTYRLTLNLTAGAPYIGPEVAVTPLRGNVDIDLQSPLGDAINTIHFKLDGITKADLRAEYTMKSSGPDRIFTQVIHLDSANPSSATYDWKLPVFREPPSSFRVTKARITKNGTTTDLTDLSGGTLDPVEQDAEITVLADGLSNF